MKNLIFVDCEADGPCPTVGKMTEFGAVDFKTMDTFYGKDDSRSTFTRFDFWIRAHVKGRATFVSDNPAFDWQWINYGFWKHLNTNPFGHSARRIGDFYAGLMRDFTKTQEWKNYRITPHDHNPVHDAMGNVEAFKAILNSSGVKI